MSMTQAMRSGSRGFKNLFVFEKAKELACETIRITEKFPKSEIHGSIQQMRRAAFSVVSNIAEGYRRGTRKEYINFLRIAYGSCGELDAQLGLAHEVQWISEEDFARIQTLANDVSGLLWRLIQSLSPSK
jgi:four helix bundle protein